MTRGKNFKRLIRARAQSTGLSYTVARESFLPDIQEVKMIPVTCQVRKQPRSEEQITVLRASLQTQSGPDGLDLTSMMGDLSSQPVLLLTEIDGPRVLTLHCGHAEANAIVAAQARIEFQRPMTHDMLNDVVVALGKAVEVQITRIENTVFHAELIVLDAAGSRHPVACRPSDAIALAERAHIPILVAPNLLQAPSAS